MNYVSFIHLDSQDDGEDADDDDDDDRNKPLEISHIYKYINSKQVLLFN